LTAYFQRWLKFLLKRVLRKLLLVYVRCGPARDTYIEQSSFSPAFHNDVRAGSAPECFCEKKKCSSFLERTIFENSQVRFVSGHFALNKMIT